MHALLWLQAFSPGTLRFDEQLALTGLVLALAAIVWSFAYTSAEGALQPQRSLFRRAADLLVLVALYVVVRIWT